MEDRIKNIEYSSKSKFQSPVSSANASKGQLVFLKHDGNKLKRRDLYLVTDDDKNKNTVTVCKILNTF